MYCYINKKYYLCSRRGNRTLNNYVESVLLDYIFNEPNETTKAAIKEAMSGRNPNNRKNNK